MLTDKSSAAIVACSDVAAARVFYTETLGLPLIDDHGDVFTLQTGSTRLNVYKSAYAGTNKANAVVWDAGGDVEAIAADLRAKGVTLEEYPEGFDSVTHGVHVKDDFRAIWFKDPDGNILHVNGAV
ncbi:MAG: VOC family protein [Sphingomonadales bacterium]|nr:MAG: VOC family protein [Sphingomonadales bacterium]